MTRLELLDKEEQLNNKIQTLIKEAETETRMLNEDEQSKYNTLVTEINDVREQLRHTDEYTILNKLTKTNTMEKRNFSILKAINEQLNGNLSEETRAVIEAGKAEMAAAGQSYKGSILIPMSEERAAIQITNGDANGGVAKIVEKTNILEPLRDKLVMVQAGATFLPNLVGDVAIPSYSGSNVGWAGEVSTAADGKGTFSEVVLKPKRLTAVLDISKQFLIQDSVGAEQMLRSDLVRAVSEKLEQTIFGKHTTATDKPDGLFTEVPADKGALTFGRLVDMEAEVEGNNVSGSMAYIMHPQLKAKCKTTLKATGGNAGFIWEGNEVNGYPVYTSNAVAKALQTAGDEYGVVFGNFNDYVIGQWGALDITVDPYTKAADGQVRLVVNAYFDAKPRREVSLVKASMK